MTVYPQTNIAVELFCVLVCAVLLIYLYMDRRSKDPTGIWFFGMVFSCICMNLGGMTDWLFSGVPGVAPGLILWGGSALFYIASGTLMLSYAGYLAAYVRKRGAPGLRHVVPVGAALSGISTLFALTSPLTHWVFYVTPGDNVYHRGDLFIASQLSTYLIYVVAAYILIRCRRLLDPRARIFFWSFSVAPLCAQLVQAQAHGAALLTPIITLSLFLVFVFIQAELRLESERSKRQSQTAAVEHLMELRNYQDELTEQIIVALSNAVEAKDRYTNGHSRRVAEYAREIVRRMGWDLQQQRRVYYAGLLHDVGKIRVADTIINKTDRLDNGEYEQIKLHTMAGYYILKEISAISEFAVGARWHHEKYDGTGYPNGLSGENIPLIARVIGVADTYDAMTSNRSYRRVMPQDAVRREIAEGAGRQFDPEIAAIMLEMIDEDTEYRMRQPDANVERVVLAVDDDPTVLRLVEDILGKEPLLRVMTASNGRRGLDIIREKRVDLVLLDMEMPELDGFDVLFRVREEQPALPVIFMTGDKELEIIQQAEDMGISDYLTKPISAHVLNESVQNVLSNSGNRQSMSQSV